MTQAWYPFYWSDYSGDTFDLSQGHHGAYILFLRFIYTSGKRINHNQRYSIARALTEQEKANADEVLNRYFVREGSQWFKNRCDEVMKEANEKHEKRVNAGKQGGKAKAERSSNSTAMPDQSFSNHNHNHIDNPNVLSHTSEKQKPYPVKFEQLWSIWPRREGKRNALKSYQQATKRVTHNEIISGCTAIADAHRNCATPDRFIPHLAT